MVITICGWCPVPRELSRVEEADKCEVTLSHGMCPECYAQAMKQVKALHADREEGS